MYNSIAVSKFGTAFFCLIFLAAEMKALAHGLYEPLPENIFEYKFDWDPTLIFSLLS